MAAAFVSSLQVRQALPADDELSYDDEHAVERIAQRVAAVVRAANDAPIVHVLSGGDEALNLNRTSLGSLRSLD